MECLRDNFHNGVLLGGRYQTISPLNHGSFGMVFLARDLKTDQSVAIKCLTKRSAAPEATSEFAIDDKSEELTLHRRLGHHPNIVNLLDSFETDSHVFIVLEFCERGDLYEAIRSGKGPLETEHVKKFMGQLIDAVKYMHERGIYHRDIKPENIFLTESGDMKLGDFGLATTDRWTTEAAVGSDRYMSPEQYDSAGAGYSPAEADVWAIGICLLNILFSRNPFTVPNESDPLFLDFSRDKQSLFDVFPSMSQDTYEVIVQCMNLDPRKRSLMAAERALRHVVSFTTDCEDVDNFCSSDPRVVASANREPLRTPSIQSPHGDTGAFPWAKALHASPQKPRQLSAIPDNESYSEDLFSSSVNTAGWMSGSVQTPSVASVMNSSLAASIASLAVIEPKMPNRGRAPAKVPAVAGSLPIMSKPRKQTAMSWVFGGRKETAVSKSWSDMWDEDIEEEQQEQARQMAALKERNSRTWSRESKDVVDNDDTPRQGLSPATKSAAPLVEQEIPSIISALSSDKDDEHLMEDAFFVYDAPLEEKEQPRSSARYSPPPKRSASSNVDKWAALGERRRAFTGSRKAAGQTPAEDSKLWRPLGYDFTSGSGSMENGNGAAEFYGNSHHNTYSLDYHHQAPTTTTHHADHGKKWGFHGDHHVTPKKDRATKDISSPWSRTRDWGRQLGMWSEDWRKEKRHVFGDSEWVDGWRHGVHS